MKTLIVGRSGQVARELSRVSWPRHFRVVQLARTECDLGIPESIRTAFAVHTPELVINAGAYTAVDQAEVEAAEARKINGDGPTSLAGCCSEVGAALVHLSTDYVFDGTKSAPYCEVDETNPLSAYGRSKLDGEIGVRNGVARHVILRTSWIFSAHGTNFVRTMLRLASERSVLRVVNDQKGGPTAARDIAELLKAISVAIENGFDQWGTFHYAGTEPTTWFELAQTIFSILPPARTVDLRPVSSAEYGAPARRPANSVLDCSRIKLALGIEQPRWRDSLATAMSELTASGSVA